MPQARPQPPEWLTTNRYGLLKELNSIGWTHVLMSLKGIFDSTESKENRLSTWKSQRMNDALFFQALHIQDVSKDPFYWHDFFVQRPKHIPLLPFTLEQLDSPPEGMNDFFSLLRVDLNCPDESLKELFSLWLSEVRTANIPFPITKKKPSPGKFRITSTEHFEVWRHHKIIEIADLDLWAELSGQSIKNRDIADWLDWGRYINPEKRVSDARNTLRSVLDSLALISAQSDAEAILALTDPQSRRLNVAFTHLSKLANDGIADDSKHSQ